MLRTSCRLCQASTGPIAATTRGLRALAGRPRGGHIGLAFRGNGMAGQRTHGVAGESAKEMRIPSESKCQIVRYIYIYRERERERETEREIHIYIYIYIYIHIYI